MSDKSFHPEPADLLHAMHLLLQSLESMSSYTASSDKLSSSTTASSAPISATPSSAAGTHDSVSAGAASANTLTADQLLLSLASQLPENGLSERATLDCLAPVVFDGAAQLGSETAFAHMDPPTPWITWVTHCWNASLNQNLLHPDVSPVAGKLEERLLQWITPFFGLTGGHLTPGSTVSNITALWAARDLRGVKRVVASASAHVSINKAARILGLELLKIPTLSSGQLDESHLPDKMHDAALVLTAGTTSEGAIDSLSLTGRAAWTHVDAAWAGPLRFSDKHANTLSGIENADSVSMSAHKWMYQPKECGVLMFRDVASANEALSVSGAYLSQPNVGLLGSHGASAVPLLATLIAWGRVGLSERIDRAMDVATAWCSYLENQENALLFSTNVSGVVLWRCIHRSSREIVRVLPTGAASLTDVKGVQWVRHVSANPNVNIEQLISKVHDVLHS